MSSTADEARSEGYKTVAFQDQAAVDPDEEVVAAFQAGGDREPHFRTLVDRYYRPIRGYFAKRIFSADDALELTQETFLGIYKGLSGFRREARFRSWAFAIAHTTYLKWLDRQKRRGSLGDRPAAGGEALPEAAYDGGEAVAVSGRTPLEDVLRKEACRKLAAAVAELPDQERRCVTLRVYHDLSNPEIAGLLGLKVGTVKAHLHHARQKLTAELRDSLGGIDF